MTTARAAPAPAPPGRVARARSLTSAGLLAGVVAPAAAEFALPALLGMPWPAALPAVVTAAIILASAAAQLAALGLPARRPLLAVVGVYTAYAVAAVTIRAPAWLSGSHLVIAVAVFVLAASAPIRRTTLTVTVLGVAQVLLGVVASYWWQSEVSASTVWSSALEAVPLIVLMVCAAAGGARWRRWWRAVDGAEHERWQRGLDAREAERQRIADGLRRVTAGHLAVVVTTVDDARCAVPAGIAAAPPRVPGATGGGSVAGSAFDRMLAVVQAEARLASRSVSAVLDALRAPAARVLPARAVPVRARLLLAGLLFAATLAPALVSRVPVALEGALTPPLVVSSIVIVVGAVAQSATVWWLPRRPARAAAVAAAVYGTAVLLTGDLTATSSWYLAPAAAMLAWGAITPGTPRRRSIGVAVLVAATMLGHVVVTAYAVRVLPPEPAFPRLAPAVVFAALYALPWLVWLFTCAEAGLWWRLASTQIAAIERRQWQRLDAERSAERRQVTDELHDVTAQHLTGLLAAIDAARAVAARDPSAARALLDRVDTEARFAALSIDHALDDLTAPPALPPGSGPLGGGAAGFRPASDAAPTAAAGLASALPPERASGAEPRPAPGVRTEVAPPTRSLGSTVPARARHAAPAAVGIHIEDLAAFWWDRGMRLSAQVDPLDELPAIVVATAYRVVREALSNAAKHAPGAAVALAVTVEPGGLVVRVRNTQPPATRGAGSRAVARSGPRASRAAAGGERAAGNRWGLPLLTSRVVSLGGTATAGPTAPGGWLVEARIPLPDS